MRSEGPLCRPAADVMGANQHESFMVQNRLDSRLVYAHAIPLPPPRKLRAILLA
jgi:hypothetical protein